MWQEGDVLQRRKNRRPGNRHGERSPAWGEEEGLVPS